MTKNKKTKHQEQENFNNKADSAIGIIVNFLLGAFIFLVIGLTIVNSFKWVTDKFSDRDSRKQRCIEETYNIKNEFTAKKMYKACMNR